MLYDDRGRWKYRSTARHAGTVLQKIRNVLTVFLGACIDFEQVEKENKGATSKSKFT